MSAQEGADRLTFTWEYSGNALGLDESDNNPIARATRRLLKGGQPFQRMSFSFFDSGSPPLRWLGAFVYSAGDRVLFFPGFANIHYGLQKQGAFKPKVHATFEVDHASLEKDRKTWHLTDTDRTIHENVPSTVDLGNSRVLWFGLSVASIDVLRIVTRGTVVSAATPSADASRRASVLRNSIADAKHNIIQLNTESKPVLADSFLHFWFVVGDAGFPDYDGWHLSLPLDHPYWTRKQVDLPRDVPVRTHRVKLSDKVDIQVTALLYPGSLSIPVAFYTPKVAPPNTSLERTRE